MFTSLLELWSLLNFVDSKEFYDVNTFLSQFGDLKEAEQVEELHARLRPYLLRRQKEHVEKVIKMLNSEVI